MSPSKQPGGVLRTPGTTSKGRKTVSFGSQVVDNEGKRGNIGKSGIPNDCPGKFPSPWTPGTQLQLDIGSDKRPRTKLTEALLDARTTTQPKSGQKPKSRDDSDITMDMGAPRSESGKYWKEQYESYAERSEKEMKKVIAKQQLAKKFAMKKDAEVTELATKFEQERRQARQRERELQQQNEDLQERLEKAMADNASAVKELAALKASMKSLGGFNAGNIVEPELPKPTFDIYEDRSKDFEASIAQSMSLASLGKENKSPHTRHQSRRSRSEPQTHPGTQPQPVAIDRRGIGAAETSLILAKSPLTSTNVPVAPAELPEPFYISARHSGYTSKPRATESVREKALPNSPLQIAPSSPLPIPSPGFDANDLWMDANKDSTIADMDKMALPVASGQPYTRPEWNPPPRQRRASKPAPQPLPKKDKEPLHTVSNSDTHKNSTREGVTSSRRSLADRPLEHTDASHRPSVAAPKDLQSHPAVSPTDPRFDVSRITAHHSEGSTQVKKDRAEMEPVDRKEKARKRLEERRKLRKTPPS